MMVKLLRQLRRKFKRRDREIREMLRDLLDYEPHPDNIAVNSLPCELTSYIWDILDEHIDPLILYVFTTIWEAKGAAGVILNGEDYYEVVWDEIKDTIQTILERDGYAD